MLVAMPGSEAGVKATAPSRTEVAVADRAARRLKGGQTAWTKQGGAVAVN
jgi:hypothetical protein